MESRQWIAVCILLAFVGACLQVAAYIAPMWMWLQVDSFYNGIGLWYSSGCGLDCTSNTNIEGLFERSSNLYFSSVEWNVLRGFETAAVIGCILLCICLIILYIGWPSWSNMDQLRIGTIAVAVITWVCVLVGIGIFAGSYYPLIIDSPKFSSQSFPWCFIMTLLALVFFVLVHIFMSCYSNQRDTHGGIPISGDTKMALTPTVTNANNGKKYYVPSPYTDDRRSNNYIENNTGRKSFGMIDDKPYANDYSNRAYKTDNDINYGPTGYRPKSYAEPSRNYVERDEISYRSTPYMGELRTSNNFPSLERESRLVNEREVRYQDREPVYSHYVDRSRPPAGARSVLPPIMSAPAQAPEPRQKYTDEIRLGASTSYIYRPYSLQKY